MIKVKFLTLLREIVGEGAIETEKKETISLLIEHLCQKYGKKFSDAILEEKGSLKEHVKIFLNGKEVNSPDKRINEGDTILMFVPVAGG